MQEAIHGGMPEGLLLLVAHVDLPHVVVDEGGVGADHGPDTAHISICSRRWPC